MPVLQGNQSETITIQKLARQLKQNPDLYNILGGAAGYSEEPLLTIVNEVVSRILDESMPWKWNRQIIPPFLTVSLQQDYITNINNIGWLENGWVVDINNSTSNNNGAPKPIRNLETVRDITWTASQSVPFNASYQPNYLASLGLWQPNTAYGCGYGVAQLPRSPIQQFMDANGNILYIDSTNLGLNIESPGFTGGSGNIIYPPGTPYPYGTSGSTQPLAPANATPGTLIQDNTVLWTVADPQAFCIRLDPVPALNGLAWLVVLQFQQSPPTFYNLTDEINCIPDYMLFLLRAGVRAALKRENGGGREADQAYAEWEQQLVASVRGGDRQQEDFLFYPQQSVMGGFNPYNSPIQIGAAWPFSPYPGSNG